MNNISKGKKVIFLIAHLSYGGAERVLSELSCNLPADIEQIIVLLEDKISYPYKARLISLNSPTFSSFIFVRIYRFLRAVYKFKKTVKREQPGCVISFAGEPNFINILTSKNPVVTIHSSLTAHIEKNLYLKLHNFFMSLLFMLKKVTIIAVSEGVKSELIKKFKIEDSKIKVIYNPTNIKHICDMSKEKVEHVFDSKLPIIITMGRLTKQKGQWHLIRAFSHVREQIPCRLAILGQGEFNGRLNQLVQELKLVEDVIFLGWQENPFKYLSKADIFVLSSLWEGFGNALIEAMACGKPVISTDCLYGPREILAPHSKEKHLLNIEYGEYGVLVPVCDGKFYKADDVLATEEKVLAKAIIEMIEDKKKHEHYSNASLRRCHDFRVDKIVKDYVSVLNSVCNFSVYHHE